jgi:tetratricopeptide (TPR) repeat protein/predicted Ser/Thr protein kinase
MTDPTFGTEDFAFLEDAFARLLEIARDERATAIAGAVAARPHLASELARLLEAHDRLGSASAEDDEPEATVSGLQIGPYRVVEKVGDGGMGEVFRAERSDGLFTQRVAIKVTRSLIGDSELRRRFVVERRILASLSHVNIVRLLDGGTTEQGQAFLIMEYVEGVPLTRHCRDRALSLEERLQLLCLVCGAVQYAHQHGVVHRDLKPANIMVTAEHVPKVVDFGVAKLLEGNAASGFTTTNAVPGPLTPNYASPEQIRGLAVTTASDVYALGVILYELVTGVRPYETQGLSLERMIEVVLREQPVKPSAARLDPEGPVPFARDRLAGDIDAIVMKAISKEPAERYGSAGELAADLSRWLTGDPVLARAPSTAYVLGRIARRHKRLVAVAAVALLAVLTATGLALWQWREARTEQARAERRFEEVRRLSNAVIFKIHDAVAGLPGSTPVRRMIVDEAIGYLERLEAESSDDPTLRVELAAAHRQIASILGMVGAANLGDRDGALKQYERARDLVRPLLTNNAPFDVVLAMVDANLAAGSILNARGDKKGVAMIREAVELASGYHKRRPDDQAGASLQARSYFGLAVVLPRDEAIPVWLKTLDYYEMLLSVLPDDRQMQRNVALVGKYLGSLYESTDQKAALKHYARSLELDERRLNTAPDDQRVWFDAAISFSNVASVSELTGDMETAERLFKRSLELRERMAKSDPSNVAAVERLGYLLARLGRFYRDTDPLLSRDYSSRSLVVLQPLVGKTGDRSLRHQFARVWYQIGEAELRLKSRAPACQAFRRADAYYKLLAGELGDDASEAYMAKEAVKQVAACHE